MRQVWTPSMTSAVEVACRSHLICICTRATYTSSLAPYDKEYILRLASPCNDYPWTDRQPARHLPPTSDSTQLVKEPGEIPENTLMKQLSIYNSGLSAGLQQIGAWATNTHVRFQLV